MPCLHKQGKSAQGYFIYKGQNCLHKNSRTQEIASIMNSSYIHIHTQTPSPIPLGLGKPTITLINIKFSHHYGKDTNVLPLPLWALLCGREFPLLESHSKSVLCRGRVWIVMRNPYLKYWGISTQSLFIQPQQMDISQTSQKRVWKCHGCRGYSTQWMDTSPYACSENYPCLFTN